MYIKYTIAVEIKPGAESGQNPGRLRAGSGQNPGSPGAASGQFHFGIPFLPLFLARFRRPKGTPFQ